MEIPLGQRTLTEKAGPFFHTMFAPGDNGGLVAENPAMPVTPTEELVLDKGMTHFNVRGASPRTAA